MKLNLLRISNRTPLSINARKRNKHKLTPVKQTLFPTADSLQEAVDLLLSRVDPKDYNVIYAGLMVYHNTLLKELTNNEK